MAKSKSQEQADANRSHALTIVFLMEGGIGVAAVVLAWTLGRPVGHLTYSTRDFWLGLLATAPLIVLFGFVHLFRRWGPFRRIDELMEQTMLPFFADLQVVDLIAVSALAGIGEELLFRGFLQTLFADWMGLWPGVVAAALLFGAVHMVTPTYGILTAIIGGYLGWIYVATGNLLVPMIAHGLYDAIALVFVLKIQTRLQGESL